MAWINTSTMLDRYNFPLYIQRPEELSTTQDASSIGDIGQALFSEGLPQEVVGVIQNANSALTNPAERLRNAVRLTMSSPYYNLN
jgi:hypothetical protein